MRQYQSVYVEMYINLHISNSWLQGMLVFFPQINSYVWSIYNNERHYY